MGYRLSWLPGRFAIARLDPTADIPVWAWSGPFASVSRTPTELSIVCPESSIPEACEADRGRQRAGENRTVGELYEEERAELLALPERPYECAARQTAKVDSSSRIRFETNAYSVPWQYVHRTVEVKAFAVFKTNVA